MRIVALDIETLGLLDAQPLPEITCACLFDGENEYCFQFYGVCPSLREQNIAKLLSLMDSAHRLVGFNAVLFDLEFIKRAFGISERQMGMWVRKTIDPFMYLKYVLHTTSGLSKLLLENHLPSKTASGREAINMAMEGRFEELLQYCLMDAKLVFQLCHLPLINVANFSRVKILFSSGQWCEARKSQPKRMLPAAPTLDQILSATPLFNPAQIEWIAMEEDV